MIKSKFLYGFTFLLILLLFMKIDYRFQDSIFCCSDDFDYLIHAETITEDFDLDYSNQLKNIEDKRFNKNNKVAPIAPIGTGILSSPFLYIGNLIENYSKGSDFMNYSLLIYSFSSIFYFFASIKLISITLNNLSINYSKYELLILISGSGVIYYAFERFSMSHIYELFTGSLIFYISSYIYTKKIPSKIYFFILPFSILLGILVRWVNYYFLFIPLLFKILFPEQTKNSVKILKNINFLIGSAISTLLFFIHTNLLYGKYTLDPRYVYLKDNISNESYATKQITISVIDYLNSLKIVLFSQEFGLLFFSPVIFIGFLIAIIELAKRVTSEGISFLRYSLLSAAYFQIISIYYIWQSAGSSYGLRYSYALIPLSVFTYFSLDRNSFIIKKRFLIFTLSIFSLFSILHFETTSGTQLSLTAVNNSWDKLSLYTQANYLSGYLDSLTNINSYLIIFTTSFLGAIFFKTLLTLSTKEKLVEFLDSYDLPVQNNDFQNYLIEIQQIEIGKFIVVILFLILMVYFFQSNEPKIDKTIKLIKS